MDFSVVWLGINMFCVIGEGVVLGSISRVRLIKGLSRNKGGVDAGRTSPSH